VPVTLNPPPFPTPDNASAVATDKAADGHGAPRDAFAALLLAVGDPVVDAGKDVANAAVPTDASDVGGNDPLRALRAALNGGQDKLPVILVPVLGRDPALAGASAQPDASVEMEATSKPDDDKPDADVLAASDLAGMTAALSALLGTIATATPVATQAAAADDSKLQADAGSRAIAGAGDAAVARRDALQADLRAQVDARTPASAVTASDVAAREPSSSSKALPAAGTAVDSISAQSQVAALQHSFAAAAAPQIAIATPVTSPAWSHEFAERLGQVVMTGADRAEFRVHPADMGPVNVSITMSADQASVTITAAHGATRDALEQALPQLRDLLANQGITLGQASVQSENRPQEQSAPARDMASSVDKSAPVAAPVRLVRLNGLVDVFA